MSSLASVHSLRVPLWGSGTDLQSSVFGTTHSSCSFPSAYTRKENCLLSGTMLIVCIEILSSTGLSRSHQETAISNCEIGTAYWLWKVVNGAHCLLLYVLQQQWHVVSLLLHLFEVLRCQKLMQTYVCHVLCYLYVDHHIIILLNLL
jgi:hypothetical protein